jgi:hypothetical protein
MTAVALPLALLFGLVAELAGGLVAWPLGGDRRWWRRVTRIGPDLRDLARAADPAARPSTLELGGTIAALFGASLAAASALDLIPGDLALVYVALALAAAGSRILAATPPTGAGEPRAGMSRMTAALSEPAFALALGVLFLRYGTFDLGSARGTQTVLGPGIALGSAGVVAGFLIAAAVAAATGGLRLSPPPERGRRVGAPRAPGGGAALLVRLSRWALAGATSMVLAVLLAGRELEPLTSSAALIQAGAAAAVAVFLGAAEALLRTVPDRWRYLPAAIALALAGAGAALVVLG